MAEENKQPEQKDISGVILVNAKEVPETKLRLSLTIFFSLITGIVTVTGFILFQYFQLKFSLEKNKDTIEQAIKRLDKVESESSTTRHSDLQYTKASLFSPSDSKDCSQIKASIKSLNEQLIKNGCQ